MTRRGAMAALLLTTLAACGDSTGGSIEGTYQLVQLNTLPLPYDHSAGCCIYTGGSLNLSASGYTAALTFQNRSSGMVSIVNEQGTYTLTGTAFAFARTGGTFTMYFYNATLDNRRITLQLGGTAPGATDQLAAAFQR